MPPTLANIQKARKHWALIVGAIAAMLEMDDPAIPLSAEIKEPCDLVHEEYCLVQSAVAANLSLAAITLACHYGESC